MTTSPCVRNCCLDQDDCCLGCGRLLNEIVAWHSADSRQRDSIVTLAAERLQQRRHLYALRHPAVNPCE